MRLVSSRQVQAGLGLLLTTWLGYTICTLTGAFFHAPGNVSYEPLRPCRISSVRSLASLHGHDPGLLDIFAVHSLELKNQWSSAPLVAEIGQEKYDLILMLRVNYHRIAPLIAASLTFHWAS